jgi:hypothetical protein
MRLCCGGTLTIGGVQTAVPRRNVAGNADAGCRHGLPDLLWCCFQLDLMMPTQQKQTIFLWQINLIEIPVFVLVPNLRHQELIGHGF